MTAKLQQARQLHQAGRLDEAARLYEEILRAEPANSDALCQLGLVWLQRGDGGRAEQLLSQAVMTRPESAEAQFYHGCALQLLGRHEDALDAMDATLRARPDNAAAHHNRASSLMALGRTAEALPSFDRAIALRPGYVEAMYHRGHAALELGRLAEALASFSSVLVLRPDHADAMQYRGVTLLALRRNEEALDCFDRVRAARAGNANLLYDRANALSNLKRFDEAIAECEALLALDPHYPYGRGVLAHCKLHACDWKDWVQLKADITLGLQGNERGVSPFDLKALSASMEEQLLAAKIWIADQAPPQPPLAPARGYRHDKIRIAYVSAEFRPHPAAQLLAGVFEHHDRAAFETVAISFGPEMGGGFRARLERAFDRFISVPTKTDAEIAATLRAAEADIVVDLMGLTGECRPRIFAARPAPVQVSFLGFPGTTGAGYMDYIVADEIVLPAAARKYFVEQPVYLPGSFMPGDDARAKPSPPSRTQAGLPENGFVFCSFNNAYKFAPETFAIWMRLLNAVPDSVLWLPQSNPIAARHLKAEAHALGVDQTRIVFAPFLDDWNDHLARLALADLFLDTLPYNAHSTANDALWMGVPVLTALGESFAGRVAASQLYALGLPELVTDSLKAYEALALKLAHEPDALAAIRQRLAANRTTSPLFDTARYTRHLEAAYTEMVARARDGHAPQSFTVEPLP